MYCRPHAYMGQVCDSEQEADCVQDVGLAGAVEPSDGVERRIEAVDLRPLAVRLEAVDDHALDIHGGRILSSRQPDSRDGVGRATRQNISLS